MLTFFLIVLSFGIDVMPKWILFNSRVDNRQPSVWLTYFIQTLKPPHNSPLEAQLDNFGDLVTQITLMQYAFYPIF